MPDAQIQAVQPQQAIDAIQKRVANPLPGFHWLDVWQQQHAAAFNVAKAAGFDVLGDIGAAVADAIQNGLPFDEFQKNLEPILKDKGWWGKGPAFDPQDGLWKPAQLGNPRRLQIIFDANMRNAFAAGAWVRAQQNAADRPYLMYNTMHDNRVRPQHAAWDGTILPINDPWWDTHYPPNGWNCRCSVITLTPAQAEQFGGVDQAPAIQWAPFLNKRNGQVVQVPDGIDPGFGFNVGQAFLAAMAGG